MRIINRTWRLLRHLGVLLIGLTGIIVILLEYDWSSSAQSDEIVPGKNLEIIGIPKVPKSLAASVKRYSGAYGLQLAGWHPERREILIKGISNAVWLTRVETPGSDPKMWIYINEPNIYDLYFQPQANYLIYNRDTDGDENFQMYLYDIMKRKGTILSEGKSRNTEFVWSNSGEQVIYCYSPRSGNGVSLYLINPFDPKSNRLLVQSTGSYLKAYDWSPDDRQAVYCDFHSNVASKLWMIDTTSGEKQSLTPQKEEDSYYSYPKFSKDGKGIYLLTNRESEFKQLAYLDLNTRKFSYLTSQIRWDVDGYQLSPDGRSLAFTANEEGVSKLYLLDTETKQMRSVTSLPFGIVTGLKWHNNSEDVAFNLSSPRSPNDVYALNTTTGELQRWAKSVSGSVDLERLPMPELIHWKSFDGRKISGYMYRPPTSFKGRRPVIIDIHGGPEEQYRPGYNHYDNYFINELGVVMVYPNVRGSSGYGKTFLDLDNGLKREDAVKDIGALLEWIKTQPDLDHERVLVQGGSYGGYIALSVAVKYGDRIRGTISDSGPSNLVTLSAPK
jgi:dipeptidyl aminopeptidase/acylaminoacyl peptidase